MNFKTDKINYSIWRTERKKRKYREKKKERKKLGDLWGNIKQYNLWWSECQEDRGENRKEET